MFRFNAVIIGPIFFLIETGRPAMSPQILGLRS
jgi:hypothetical protein